MSLMWINMIEIVDGVDLMEEHRNAAWASDLL